MILKKFLSLEQILKDDNLFKNEENAWDIYYILHSKIFFGVDYAMKINNGIGGYYYKLENKGENVIFSPLSFYQVLSLVLNGAGGKTREEVFKVLFPDKDLDEQLIKDVNSNIEKIITDIESENKNSRIFEINE